MDKLTAIKIKYDDGTYSDEIPVSVLSKNVVWDSTHTLIDVLGSIDIDVTGTIQDQISQLFNEKVSATQLQNYVASQLNEDVSTWLNNNVDPVGSAVVVDKSLTVAGAAADAKTVGEKIGDVSNIIVHNKNLFNGEWLEGYFVNQTNGQLGTNSLHHTCNDYIEIKPSTTYIISDNNSTLINIRYAFYDINKTFISGGGEMQGSFASPANAVYLRFSTGIRSISVQLEEGSVPTEYVPYHTSIDPNLLPLDDINQIIEDDIGIIINNTIVKNYSDESFYNIGDLTYYNKKLYQCIDNITSFEQFDVNHWNEITIADNFKSFLQYEEKTITTVYYNTELEWNNGMLYYTGQIYTGTTYDIYRYTFIPVKAGDIIYGGASRLCCYDANDNPINHGVDMPNPFTIPNDIVKIGVTINDNDTRNFIVESNKIIPFIKKDVLPSDFTDDVVEQLQSKKQFIKPENTTFFVISPNLVNPEEDYIDGYFVNQTNGALNENANYAVTLPIEVTPGHTYAICFDEATPTIHYIRYAIYNEANTFLVGKYAETLEDRIITIPNNGKFLRFSVGIDLKNKWMFAESDTIIPFQPYGKTYIDKQYIPQNTDIILPTVNLPSKIYALVGYELNIYFDNLLEFSNNYLFDVSCSKGMQLERGFRITPTEEDIGTWPLSITIYDKTWNLITTVSSSLIITSATAGSGISNSIIVLGDSTTNNGVAVTKLNLNFSTDTMNITTLGTRGTAPNNHEGRSGWRFSSYFGPPNEGDIKLGVENPWYNPTTKTFDANYYFNNTSIAKPDWLFINLGINDVFSYNTDETLQIQIEACKNYCNQMIDSINNASPNTKIGICLTIPPNSSQDAYGKAYKNSQFRIRYKRNNVLWVHDLINTYDNREDEGIYLIPIYTNLDTVYNMGMETLPVNARNTEITYQSPIANGGVHPVESGYWQIADVYTAFLKAQENE